MDGEKLKFGFLNNHSLLMTRLSTQSILPYVYSEGLITQTEKGIINHLKADGLMTDRLLDIIHKQGISNPAVYRKFFSLLSDDSVTAGQNLGNVLKRIMEDSLSDDVRNKFGYERRFLEENENAALLKHKWTIVQSLSVEDVLPDLMSMGVVSITEKEEIKSVATPNEEALELYSIVQKRGSKGFNFFVTVLLNSTKYSHLGRLLHMSAQDVDPSTPVDQGRRDCFPVEEVLKRGHVPPRQGVYVERKKMIQKIRNALYHLKDKEGWVLVHGIAGFGKTVLAAEAVRDAKMLEEVFTGGVHWLTVGNIIDQYGDVDRGMLLSKIQALVLRLDKKHINRQLPSVESAKDYLQEVIAEQHPRSLLILDDVWSHEVINAFSVRCRIFVTSRVAALISPVVVKNSHFVSVSEGFSDEEGKLLLAQWLGKDPKELSSYSDKILEHCRGSPMAIALIGAMLRKNSSERKWKAIAEKMETEHSLHLSMRITNWNYQHPTLKSSIQLSVQSLPDELKDHFDMLSVFDYDCFIPVKVLETIWKEDDVNAEEYMDVFADYSLANKCMTIDENASPRYTIHDIIMDYLKGSVSETKQCDLHRLVVERYKEKCDNGAFHKLEDDKYIYRKMIGHIIAAKNFELLGSLLTQLQWLISCVVYGDANLLLSQYRDYKSKVPQNFQTDVQKFELFLSGHMFVLANDPIDKDDILQLALLQPNDSEICTQASTIIKEKSKQSWYKWSNKDSDPEKYALKLKLHNEGVTCCKFTENGKRVLSCSGTEIKLWDSSTGTVFGNFRGHKDRVTCCAISDSGRLILSSSEDNTVKVWESRTQRLVCDFTDHQYGVQCCALSPDNKWVISADIDSVVIMWDVLLGTVKSMSRLGMVSPAITPTPELSNQPPNFQALCPYRSSSQESSGGGEGVLCCTFSPDGTQFITASQNGTIRLWDLSSFSVILSYRGHSAQVRCCVFSNTGTQLASASLDHTAKVWDPQTGKCNVKLDHGEFPVLCCDFSQDVSRLITGDTTGSVKVWSLPHGILLQDLPLHWDYVNCVLYSPKTQNILSAADNGIVKILWSDEIEEESKHVASAVQYHRRFSTYFLTDESGGYQPIVLCYIEKENKLQIVRGFKAEVVDMCLPTVPGANPRSWIFSKTGDKIGVGYMQGMMQVIQIDLEKSSASEMWRFKAAHNKEVLKCYFSPDGTKIASCCYTEHKVWSVATGELIASIAGRGIGVKPCIFFDDSTRIASITETCVLLWNSNSGSSLTNFNYSGEDDTILCINLSKDNKRLVASITSGLVVVWSVSGGEVLLESSVMPLSSCARSCALSPDGSYAVAGFDDGSMKVWNINRKLEVAQQYTGSAYWMIDVCFSPDGSKIVTLCDSIEWWKTDGTHLKMVLLKGTFGKYIRFSPDFHTFVTIDNAGLLYILTTVE